jgi:hypothetical protein
MIETSRYQNGKIYQITDIGYTKCYVGSTVQTLSTRMSGHRNNYRRYMDGMMSYNSCFSLFEEFGIENCKIELLELYQCNSKAELEKKEGEYIKKSKCVNKRISGRSAIEYYQDNRESQLAKIKQNYLNNKDCYIICECNCQVRKCSYSNHIKTKKHNQLVAQKQQQETIDN